MLQQHCLLLVACAGGIAAASSLATGAPPQLQFSRVIQGGVLQRGERTAVWGEGAKAGATVVVTLHTNPPAVVHTEATSAGHWNLTLPVQSAAWNVKLSAVSDGVSTSTSVSIGVVIQCAGQSNMDMPVACHLPNRTACYHPKLAFHADNGTAEVGAAGQYTDKIFMLKAVNSKYERVNKPHWQTATSTAAFNSYPAAFSAVCWYTGKSLFEKLGSDTPVGLLQTSVGGSPIEYWLPPESSAHVPVNVNSCERDVPQCDNQYVFVRGLGNS